MNARTQLPTGDLIEGAPFYLILAPGAVLDANGARQWNPVGAVADLRTATIHAGAIPGAAVVLNLCLFINPVGRPAPVKPAA